jgi:hypothetical protein
MFVALALFAWMLTFSPMVNAESPPDSGIIEKIESQLLQIDLTVRGPSQALAGLTADDFEAVRRAADGDRRDESGGSAVHPRRGRRAEPDVFLRSVPSQSGRA